jgi:uncharacterized membrane protein YedE/YeeE
MERPLLHWLTGGLALGGLLLLAVWLFQPLGVSTQYVRAVGGVADVVDPGISCENPYFIAEKITFGYGEMLVLGIPLGAFLASTLTRRRSRESVPQPWRDRFGASKPLRFGAAFLGGFLLLFGARLAGGCTSGHILSGVSQLAVSSIVFFLATFGVAVFVAQMLYPSKEL